MRLVISTPMQTEVANRFTVESISGTQVGNLVKRWGFTGVGIVSDPLLPKVDFMNT